VTVLTDYIDEQIAALGAPADRVAPDTLGYGTDLSCVSDVTPQLDEVDPESVLGIGQAIARRLTTARGQLLDDANYGTDLRGYLNNAMTTAALRDMASQVRAECLKDDRVVDADVTRQDYSIATRSLELEVLITPDSLEFGEFTLVFFVTADTVELVGSIDQNG
jgi:phage baseplate assembly protein W